MGKRTVTLDPELLSRREAVRRVGNWIIFTGVLGGAATVAAGCSPDPIMDVNGVSSSETPTPTGSGSTPTPTPTGTVDACGCNATPSGTNTNLTRTSIPSNGVAYNSAAQVFICHDSNGYYCIDSICTHAGCDMGTLGGGYTASNLGSGFYCSCHGSKFDANGAVTQGPAGQALKHYQVAFDGSGKIWADYNKTVSSSCRCT